MRSVYRDPEFKSIRYARFTEPADTILKVLMVPALPGGNAHSGNGFQDGYFYFPDERSLLERLLNEPYTDEQECVINVPPAAP